MHCEILQGPDIASLDPLAERTIAVLGYGNQGRAHALNLRDSGLSVIIGQRLHSPGADRAKADGFDPRPLADAAAQADLVIIALPDEIQPQIWKSELEPALREGSTIGFLHGYAIRFHLIHPRSDLGIVMVAPKGPGTTLRERFDMGQGIPAIVAIHQDNPTGNARDLAFAWAAGIGCARAGLIITGFAEETETDLFGEQAVLCGGMTELILAAFQTLVDAGYPPELAYLECCHEVKQVADLVYARGLSGMMRAISNTAEFGAYRSGPAVITSETRERLDHLLESIRSGEFARAFQSDLDAGGPLFEAERRRLREHPIETAGNTVRRLMPWLNPSDAPTPPKSHRHETADEHE